MLLAVSKIGNHNEQRRVEWPVEKSKTPGLCIHKHPLCYGDEVKPFRKQIDSGYWWTVSHEATGKFLVDMIPSKKQAHEIAQRLGELDWTIDYQQMDKQYSKLVKQIRAELKNERR